MNLMFLEYVKEKIYAKEEKSFTKNIMMKMKF